MFGVGLPIADRIARAAGVAAADGRSARGPRTLHLLAEAERSGSTCLPLERLLAGAARAARRRRAGETHDRRAGRRPAIWRATATGSTARATAEL